jgi:hypothetical protein
MVFVGANFEDFVSLGLHLQAAVVVAKHTGRFLPLRHGDLLLQGSALYTMKRKAASSNSQNSLQEKTRGETRKERAMPLLERPEEDIVRSDIT